MLKSAKARALFAVALAIPFAAAAAEKTGLGRPALPEEVKAWDIDVRPDGLGLPDGKGSVSEGEALFQTKCSACHGEFGEGAGRWPVLAGGKDSLKSDRPEKTVGSFWPNTSTVFDYVHRAMPFGDALSLKPDEVYALTAYILNLNDLVPSDFVLSKDNFPKALPNEKGFYDDDRETTEKSFWKKDPCMTNCKVKVEITGHAANLDVTPDDQKDNKDEKPSAGVE